MSTGPRRLGKYELFERLGRGGMAEVWKAFDAQLERYVAIKILHADLQNDPDFMKRFIREARVVASLHHPNIVQLHDFQISPLESNDTTAYMVMDYIQGQTLAEYIRMTSRIGNFPLATEIVHLFSCIGSAVDYAHQHGMIHRDIKPSNILLDKRNSSRSQLGIPILADFGIVKVLGAATGTLSGGWLGTPLYISPEQAQGRVGNERSDIYSLGVILYEICTGVPPFQGDNPVSIIMQHLSTDPMPPALLNPRVTPALADVIMCNLAKDPAARFPSALAMAKALADAFNLPPFEYLAPPTSSANALGDTPSSPALPSIVSPTTPVKTVTTPVFKMNEDQLYTHILSSTDGQGSSITPVSNVSEVPAFVNSGLGRLSSQVPQEFLLTPPTPPSRPRRGRKGPFIATIVLLLLLVVGSGLGAFYLLSHHNPATPASQIVGHVAFISDDPFVGDQLQIDLQHIPAPDPGQSYYGWLLGDNNIGQSNCPSSTTTTSIFLGVLPVNHGQIAYRYPGDQQHTNLIDITSRFLITEEGAKSAPRFPSADKHTWHYYASLAQGSVLDALHCLLSVNINLPDQVIHNGLDIQFFRNTENIWEWAISIKNLANPASIRSLVERILVYLDGATQVQADVAGIPISVQADDQTLAQIPLIDLVHDQNPTSYEIRIDSHLIAISLAPDTEATAEMQVLATQADQALGNVRTWLGEARLDVKQLLKLSDAQLLQASALRNDLATEVNYAYSGQINPSTNQVQLGIQQIHQIIQRMAMFDVKLYSETS